MVSTITMIFKLKDICGIQIICNLPLPNQQFSVCRSCFFHRLPLRFSFVHLRNWLEYTAVGRYHLPFGSINWIPFALAHIQSVDCICAVWYRRRSVDEMIVNENDSMNAILANPLITSSLMTRDHSLKIAQETKANIVSKHSWKHNLRRPDVDKAPYLVFVRILTKLYLFLWNNSSAAASQRTIILHLWGSNNSNG